MRKKIKDKGLPGKSFIYIVELDNYLKMAYSLMSVSNYLDLFAAAQITYRFKQKHRKQSVNSFINYMCTYDAQRVDFLFGSYIPRSVLLKFLNSVVLSLSKLEECIFSSELEKINYLAFIHAKWGEHTRLLKINLTSIYKNICKLQTLLANHYIRHIVGGLMSRRKGEYNPNSLTGDAYFVLLEMLDKYDYNRSKIPFSNFLKFFIRSGKHKVIQSETWGLKDGSLLSFDKLFDDSEAEEESSFKEEIDPVYSTENSFLNHSLVEEAINELPKPFYDLVVLNFGLIDPLTPDEEKKLRLEQKRD